MVADKRASTCAVGSLVIEGRGVTLAFGDYFMCKVICVCDCDAIFLSTFFLSIVLLVKRSEIKTPWEPYASQDELTEWYQLSALQELKKPIKFHAADKTSIRSPRWTSQLGLIRARFLSEIALETEPEWRLYEKLNAIGIPFFIEAMQPKELSKAEPVGRASFRLDEDVAIRYLGKKGFQAVKEGIAVSFSSVEDVVAWVGE